jgi:hypothetical protein
MVIEHVAPRQQTGTHRRPAAMTSAGDLAPRFDDLPRDLAELVGVIQGLLIHEHIAPAYGVTISDEQRSAVHLRPVRSMLERLLAEDDRPLTVARAPERRLVGNCRQYTVLLTAVLRSQGVPARARCGFGSYFGTATFEDHWVGEYWNEAEGRWILVDAQIDDVQRGLFHPDFDLLDVPRDRFLVAGDAWTRCRAGDDDPARFGLSFLNEGGLWWIAGNLVRDVAALNNMEMLPWDVWGAMPGPNETIQPEVLSLFDGLAELTGAPRTLLAELTDRYEGDDRLRVPATVFNAVLQREDPV